MTLAIKLGQLPSTTPHTTLLPKSISRRITLVIKLRSWMRNLCPGHDEPPRRATVNFGDATSPGGGFLIGLPTQEETIARLSTLYLFLMAYTAQQFYNLHHRDEKGGFYHHAFVYTPAVVVMRNDAGEWASPYDVDVLTSAAVNVGAVRREIGESVAHEGTERQIEVTMRERMARILFLFEEHESKESHFGKLWNGSVQK